MKWFLLAMSIGIPFVGGCAAQAEGLGDTWDEAVGPYDDEVAGSSEALSFGFNTVFTPGAEPRLGGDLGTPSARGDECTVETVRTIGGFSTFSGQCYAILETERCAGRENEEGVCVRTAVQCTTSRSSKKVRCDTWN